MAVERRGAAFPSDGHADPRPLAATPTHFGAMTSGRETFCLVGRPFAGLPRRLLTLARMALTTLNQVAEGRGANYSDKPGNPPGQMPSGFREGHSTVCTDRPHVFMRLRRAAFQTGLAPLRESLETPSQVTLIFWTRKIALPWGHPHLLLTDATLNRTEADFTASTRLDSDRVTEWTAHSGTTAARSYKATELTGRGRTSFCAPRTALSHRTVEPPPFSCSGPYPPLPHVAKIRQHPRPVDARCMGGTMPDERRSRARMPNAGARHRFPLIGAHLLPIPFATTPLRCRRSAMTQALSQLASRYRPFTERPDTARPGVIHSLVESDAVRSDATESDTVRSGSGRRPGLSGLRCGVRLFVALAVLLVVCAAYDASAYAAAGPDPYLALAKSVNEILDNIRNWIMGILAGLATVFLTIGGVRYVLAGGDPGEVEKAKTAFKSAGWGYGLAALAPLVVEILKGIVGN